jgi:hypothetical protein
MLFGIAGSNYIPAYKYDQITLTVNKRKLEICPKTNYTNNIIIRMFITYGCACRSV